MATADEYAKWIVDNSAKKGTPDFDIVAKAYEEAKASETMQPEGFNAAKMIGNAPASLYRNTIGGLYQAVTNPLQTANLGLSAYDRMNASQAPLQPSPMLNAQQLMGQQGPVPTPQFNSLLQPSRRPILIG
jgi:hypothetical protein